MFITIMPISSPYPTYDNLLESSRRDDSYKWSNIGCGEEIIQLEAILLNYVTPGGKYELLTYDLNYDLRVTSCSVITSK